MHDIYTLYLSKTIKLLICTELSNFVQKLQIFLSNFFCVMPLEKIIDVSFVMFSIISNISKTSRNLYISKALILSQKKARSPDQNCCQTTTRSFSPPSTRGKFFRQKFHHIAVRGTALFAANSNVSTKRDDESGARKTPPQPHGVLAAAKTFLLFSSRDGTLQRAVLARVTSLGSMF